MGPFFIKVRCVFGRSRRGLLQPTRKSTLHFVPFEIGEELSIRFREIRHNPGCPGPPKVSGLRFARQVRSLEGPEKPVAKAIDNRWILTTSLGAWPKHSGRGQDHDQGPRPTHNFEIGRQSELAHHFRATRH